MGVGYVSHTCSGTSGTASCPQLSGSSVAIRIPVHLYTERICWSMHNFLRYNVSVRDLPSGMGQVAVHT